MLDALILPNWTTKDYAFTSIVARSVLSDKFAQARQQTSPLESGISKTECFTSK